MKSYRTRRFNKLLAQLPKQAQEQAHIAYQLFKLSAILTILVFTSSALTPKSLSIRFV